MINKETILSNYNDRLTLLQWLKKVELALQNASAKEFRVNQLGNATLTFSIVFDDNTELTTGPIVLQQGESVASATISGGHLLLTLTNGDVLDAGDVGAVSSFSIDGSQHLIVAYQDGTTQDLGAIFSGNVNVAGNFTADSIIENMSGYSASITPSSDYDFENVYTSAVKNGNKLTLVSAVNITRLNNVTPSIAYVDFIVPTEVYNKLYYTLIGGYNILNFPIVKAVGEDASIIDLGILVMKPGSNVIRLALHTATIPNLVLNKKYYVRLEATFLLNAGLI